MNLSFAGCGFLGIYHVGVASCFKKYRPHLLLDKVSGASAGAIAACCLLCDLPIEEMMKNLLRLAKEARQRTLGPFSPSFNVQEILLESLQKILPEDAHIRVSGKLHISLTRVYDGKNVIVSQFNSREDLFQALLASSFIPIFCGLLPPRFHGIRYMDGGFSDNLPTLNENTITVSPFCGESDICPRDDSSQLFHVNLCNTSIELSRQNMYRFARVLFPPNPERLSKMCKQGFDDALRFLNRNNLINCNKCLAVQSTFVVSETLEDNSTEYDPECVECKMHRQEALVANLPETVLMIFQDAIDSANKGLVNWLFKHKSVKLLSLLSLPYTLPADIVYATFTKFLSNTPKFQKSLLEMSRYFLEQLSLIFPKINVYYQPIPQIIKCHVNIFEYGSKIYNVESIDNSIYNQHKTNLNLTLKYDDADSWTDCKQSAKCVINMSDLEAATTAVDTFENILQDDSNEETMMAYYYLPENDKANITEIFDVHDNRLQNNEDFSNHQIRDSSLLTNTSNNDWDDEPRWMIEQNEENYNRQNLDQFSEMSIQKDDVYQNNFLVPENENSDFYSNLQTISVASIELKDDQTEVNLLSRSDI